MHALQGWGITFLLLVYEGSQEWERSALLFRPKGQSWGSGEIRDRHLLARPQHRRGPEQPPSSRGGARQTATRGGGGGGVSRGRARAAEGACPGSGGGGGGGAGRVRGVASCVGMCGSRELTAQEQSKRRRGPGPQAAAAAAGTAGREPEA